METIKAGILLAGLLPEGAALAEQEITLVTTDSREICPGCVFVAFPGTRFDGHDFAAEALRRGAACVVLNHEVEGVPAERRVLCPDSYRAMMLLGANYRAQYRPKVIGITGSVGKTTTKEFTYAVLSEFGRAIKTEGNQNNELGLPRTLLRIGADTEFAAVEMGMSHAGEIARLARCARPDAGIITCIGVSHIENLGSREAICAAKLEICEGLAEGAPLALNYDDPHLRAAVLPEGVRPVWFSLCDPAAEICAEDICQTQDGMAFVLNDRENGRFAVRIPSLGQHTVADALAAYAAATRLGLDAGRAVRALEGFRQTGMRQHVVESGGVFVIEDCYNANPDSMRAALKMFETYPCRRRFALLGDMLELGEIAPAEHEELGRLAARSGLELLITYGSLSEGTAAAAKAAGQNTLHAADYAAAAEALQAAVRPGDAILVKASRGMALEKALAIFYAGRG